MQGDFDMTSAASQDMSLEEMSLREGKRPQTPGKDHVAFAGLTEATRDAQFDVSAAQRLLDDAEALQKTRAYKALERGATRKGLGPLKQKGSFKLSGEEMSELVQSGIEETERRMMYMHRLPEALHQKILRVGRQSARVAPEASALERPSMAGQQRSSASLLRLFRVPSSSERGGDGRGRLSVALEGNFGEGSTRTRGHLSESSSRRGHPAEAPPKKVGPRSSLTEV